MLRASPGLSVQLTIPLLGADGLPIAPVALRVRVVDETGVERLPWTAVEVEKGATEVDLGLAPAVNSLPAGKPQAIHRVELEATTEAGVQVLVQRYALSALEVLTPPVNSFQTYDQALLETLRMPRMEGWEGGGEDRHVPALLEAYTRLTRIGYRITHLRDLDSPPAGNDFWPDELIPPRYWPFMTAERFYGTRYPERFREALRRAQIAEANEILAGDPVRRRRQSGVMSESVGESSMFFRPGKPLDLGVSAEALTYLTGFLDIRMTITRS